MITNISNDYEHEKPLISFSGFMFVCFLFMFMILAVLYVTIGLNQRVNIRQENYGFLNCTVDSGIVLEGDNGWWLRENDTVKYDWYKAK